MRKSTPGFWPAVSGALAIGWAPVLARLTVAPPAATAWYRMAVAVAMLLPLYIVWVNRDPNRQLPSRKDIGLLLLAGAALGADIGVWHYALELTSVTSATLLVNMLPVALIAWTWGIRGETPSFRLIAAFAAGMAGLVILVWGGGTSARTGNISGDALALVACGFYAAYLLLSSHLASRFDGLTLITWTTIGTLVSLTPLHLVESVVLADQAGEMWMTIGGWWTVPTVWPDWRTLLLLAVVCQVMGQGLMMISLATLPISIAGVLFLLQVVMASVGAVLVLDEILNRVEIVGSAMIALAVLVIRTARAPAAALKEKPS